MKLLSFSFLFCLLCLFGNSSYSQSQNKSERHHYDAINSPKNLDDLQIAITFYKEKKEAALSNGELYKAINDLRMIAIGEFKLGFIYDSEQSAVEALTLVERLEKEKHKRDIRIGLYNHLGKVYRSINNDEKALQVYNEALAISSKKQDSITLYNNIANVYKDKKEYSYAKTLLQKAHAMGLNTKDVLQQARTLDNLGYVEFKLGAPEALFHLEAALAMRLSKNDPTDIYSSNLSLAEYYADKDKKQAALYAAEAYRIANELDNDGYRMDALALFSAFGDNPQFAEYKKISDSISKAKHMAANKYAFMKWEVEKERKNTEMYRLQKENEASLKLLYQVIGGSILLLAILVIIIVRSRHEREKAQQIHAAESRISKKVHDEVANDLFHLMTKIQAANGETSGTLDDLEGIYAKTRDIAKEIGGIDVSRDFDLLLIDLLESYRNDTVNIITRNIAKMPWDTLSEAKKTAVYRVLQELMTNMRKHSRATLVAIVCTKHQHTIQIEYTDNGVGVGIKEKQGGLLNTENRMESVKGSIRFESEVNEGFKAIITI